MIEPYFNLALAGTSGRMGRMILAALREEIHSEHWTLVGAHSSSQSEVDGVSCTTDRAKAFSGADVVIDFSHPSQFRDNLDAAVDAGAACLIGTTALPPGAHAALDAAGEKVPVMHAPNASFAVAVLSGLVEHAASALPSFDIEILDFHHAAKLDTPSGTARLLADVAKYARLPAPEIELTGDREAPRKKGSIGIASLRGGNTAGEHRVIFAGESERLEIHHIAHDRTPFARDALAFAGRLAFAPKRNYDVRGLLAEFPARAWSTPPRPPETEPQPE